MTLSGSSDGPVQPWTGISSTRGSVIRISNRTSIRFRARSSSRAKAGPASRSVLRMIIILLSRYRNPKSSRDGFRVYRFHQWVSQSRSRHVMLKDVFGRHGDQDHDDDRTTYHASRKLDVRIDGTGKIRDGRSSIGNDYDWPDLGASRTCTSNGIGTGAPEGLVRRRPTTG